MQRTWQFSCITDAFSKTFHCPDVGQPVGRTLHRSNRSCDDACLPSLSGRCLQLEQRRRRRNIRLQLTTAWNKRRSIKQSLRAAAAASGFVQSAFSKVADSARSAAQRRATFAEPPIFGAGSESSKYLNYHAINLMQTFVKHKWRLSIEDRKCGQSFNSR